MVVGFIGFVAFGVAYWVGASTQWEAVTLGVGLLVLGFGVTAWGKYLMPQGPFVEERHVFHSTEAERGDDRGDHRARRHRGQAARSCWAVCSPGIDGHGDRPPVPPGAVARARSTGQRPSFTTNWKKGSKLVTIDGREVTSTTSKWGACSPCSPRDTPVRLLTRSSCIRPGQTLAPLTSSGADRLGRVGYVAYSKMCTHLGCPVGLYQEQTQQLVCPCHQSIFNVLAGAVPEFGPAPRPLPQLPITVDAAGFLRARAVSTRRSGPDSGSGHDRQDHRQVAPLGRRPPGRGQGRRTFLDKIFPDHWSFMLGEIALYSFVVLLVTGVFLSLYYIPSAHEIVYHGSYLPLRGQKVSEAYASSVGLSFDVRSGLLMRQAHHWAADIFLGSIAVHMARVFFTGAFRKPREFNWIVGVTMLILGIVNGFLGYSLPDDLVSGTGIRIAYSIIESIPLVGSYIAFFLFGGNYPGNGVDHPPVLHHPRADRPPDTHRPAGRPPRLVGQTEAHPVSGERKDRTQRGRVAHVPDIHGQDDRLPVHGHCRHLPAGGLRPDQPHLAVRPVRALPDLLRSAARLVHGLA